ncbi:DUF488 domain-containing protein [Treponema sp.]
MILLKRAYDEVSPTDGIRILVDRLWPRGVKKNFAQIDIWLKEISPSTGLRKWFAHQIEKWEEFKLFYYDELDRNPEPVQRVIQLAMNETVTLVYGAKDTEHSHALALKSYLDHAIKQVRVPKSQHVQP